MIERKNRLSHIKSPRRGVIIPIVGFMMVVLLGTIAFVADLGNLIVVKTTLGASADAAALAGAGAMSQSYQLSDVTPIAVQYGQANVPANYGEVLDASNVTYGTWDPVTHTFTPNNVDPDAIRVTVERTHARANQVPYFFARVFGLQSTEVDATAIAVGANSTSTPLSVGPQTVYVTSTKNLSNVVLNFGPDLDGNSRHQKFEGLGNIYSATYQGTGEYEGLEIVGVWIKSGCNESGDGPGYGEYIANPGDGYTAHGTNQASGCVPHVTATFEATGVEFVESGAPSPVRLVL